MMPGKVFIVDDDVGLRTSLSILMGSAQLTCECFASAEEFLHTYQPQMHGCLLLDVRMQGMSGPQLQEELLRRKIDIPIIFLSGHAEVGIAVDAMRAGAVDFLPKPLNGALLLDKVVAALAGHETRLQVAEQRAAFEKRLAKLSQRERQVLALTLEGMGNKEIASKLDLSVRTIEGHRATIYLKAGVSSVMDLLNEASHSKCSMQELLKLLRT
jgi:two-component system, LuxR family, response regulator FixJ